MFILFIIKIGENKISEKVWKTCINNRERNKVL